MAYSRETLIQNTTELAKIVSQEKFAAVIADLREAEMSGQSDQEKVGMLERAKKDPKAFLENRGITLPANATAKITQNGPIELRICIVALQGICLIMWNGE